MGGATVGWTQPVAWRQPKARGVIYLSDYVAVSYGAVEPGCPANIHTAGDPERRRRPVNARRPRTVSAAGSSVGGLADIRCPSPGFYAAMLHTLAGFDTRDSTTVSAFGDLVEHLTVEQGEWFETAFGDLLRLLRGDVGLLRSAAVAAVQFDLVGAAGNLVNVVAAARDLDVKLAAASLASNPAAGASCQDQMSRLVVGDRMARIRLQPEQMEPITADEDLLMRQCLPGRRRDETRPRLPAVVVADRALGQRAVLWVALRALSCGATVRQLNPGRQIPDWFADATVLVCADASERVVRRSLPAGRTLKSVIVDRVDTYADTADIVDRVNVLLVSELRLHVPKPATAAETKLLADDAAG